MPSASNIGKPPCRACFSLRIHLMAIFQFLHQPLYLSTSKTRQNLLQLFERSSNIVILPDMFQQQRLIGIFVQTNVSCMHAGLSCCRIQASCKDILFSADMLHNTHFDQSRQACLHFSIERTIVVKRINGQEVFRGQQLCTSFTDAIDHRKHRLVND